MPRKFTMRFLPMTKKRLFKIRWGNDNKVFILRIDILYKSLFVIYRKKGLYDYLEDLVYGYL